jgi:kynureninase
MSLKAGFSRFLDARPERLHFAAHSHHPWPDVTYDAHLRTWTDAAEMMDDKWSHVFGSVFERTREKVADLIGADDPRTITFAPNTHEFVVRIFSCLEPPVRVLTTDAEFHSFNRQSRRWEEEGLAIVDRVPAEPFESFAERFTSEARPGVHDLIFISEVFFDSGFVVPGLDRIVSAVPEQRAFIVIDGYHAFMARPVSIRSIQDRVFYLAGGYKYAMAGEGVCFMHAPPGFGDRPVDTGWYAGFGQLESGVSARVSYGSDASRFAGATFDPSGIYRLNAVLDWLAREGVGPTEISKHVQELQTQFMEIARVPGELMPEAGVERGNFLTYRTEQAGGIYGMLHDRKVITDYRGDRLRIGFGIYQDSEDVERLADVLSDIL